MSQIKNTLRSAVNACLELLFAPRSVCVACGDKRGSDNGWLCAQCNNRLALHESAAAICRNCGEVTSGECCPVCGTVSGTYTAVSAFSYDEVVKGIVSAFKFKSVYRLDDWMADRMTEALEKAGVNGYDIVTYVPLHKSRYYERGYNQSEKLALRLSEKCGCRCENLLIRVRRTDQQAKLSAQRRRENLNGAFSAIRQLDGEKVLLIDDVRTTGTTAAMCAGELMKAGAGDVVIATFAAAEKQ